MGPLYRHGDVLVQLVDTMPAGVREARTLVLAHGEVTGHTHRIAETDGRAALFHDDSGTFLRLTAPATLVHEEHATIELPPGTYRVWRQREYVPPEPDAPAGFRIVVD